MLVLPAGAAEVLRVAHEVAPDGRVWWQVWRLDPTFLIPVALLTWWYLRGLREWPDRSRPHPHWRTGMFLVGIALLVLVQESPLDRLAAHHLTFHMVQHEIVMMLAVPAMLLGAPATPVLRGMPRWLRQGLVNPVAGSQVGRGVYRGLTSPGAAALVFVGTVWAWHLVPGWYDAALRQPSLHVFQHASFGFAATLFWWNVIEAPPHRPRLEAMPRVLYLVIVGALKDGAAAFVVFASLPLYQEYGHVARIVTAWTPLRDQQIGGLMMWVPGTVIMLGAAGAIFLGWFQAGSTAPVQD